MLVLPDIDALVAAALAEDLGVDAARLLPGPRLVSEDGEAPLLESDVTTSAVVPASATFSGRIVARQDCVVCGLPVAERVFTMLTAAAAFEQPVEVFPLVAEGASVTAGQPVAEVEGPAAVVLAGERTALDFVMTLSGIATAAHAWQEAAGPELAVVDTRKTWPGLRALSKYAVRVGGASNHRAGLWDMVLVKDNHIRHAGTIAEATVAASEAHPELMVEVEADTVEQAAEAAEFGADIVLLDNMDDATLAKAVQAVRKADGKGVVLTEASGGITIERLAGIAKAHVDRVSSSAITLAAPVDFGLDEG